MRILVTLLALTLFVVPVRSKEKEKSGDLLGHLKEACQAELDGFCKQVTPGEGRLLACFYAFEDKLSPRCEYALYDAALQLERASAAFAHGATECQADLKKHCGDVQPGEGRIVDCLEKHKDKLTSRCRKALKDIGLE